MIPGLATVAGAIGKAALGAVKHVTGVSHVASHLNPGLATVARAIGKAALGAVKHVTGVSHVASHLNEVPTSAPQLLEALGGRGFIGLVIGLYLGNPEFRGHIDSAIASILPF